MPGRQLAEAGDGVHADGGQAGEDQAERQQVGQGKDQRKDQQLFAGGKSRRKHSGSGQRCLLQGNLSFKSYLYNL